MRSKVFFKQILKERDKFPSSIGRVPYSRLCARKASRAQPMYIDATIVLRTGTETHWNLHGL